MTTLWSPGSRSDGRRNVFETVPSRPTTVRPNTLGEESTTASRVLPGFSPLTFTTIGAFISRSDMPTATFSEIEITGLEGLVFAGVVAGVVDGDPPEPLVPLTPLVDVVGLSAAVRGLAPETPLPLAAATANV